MSVGTVPAGPQITTTACAQLLDELIPVARYQSIALAVVFIGSGATVEGADEQYAAAQRATKFLMGAAHSTGQTRRRAAYTVIYPTPQVLAHGEYDGL